MNDDSKINALKIWKKLSESDECRAAVRYFGAGRGQKIFVKGAADFDEKYCANDEREKAHYRTDYYVSTHGYMDMHLKQNRASFRHCFKNGDIPQPLLLVDFGCGPMTAGLALAEILSTQTPDYKAHTAYFGIDASRNMVNKARCINKEHALFKHFKAVQDTRFNSQQIPSSFPAPQLLCFVFHLCWHQIHTNVMSKRKMLSSN